MVKYRDYKINLKKSSELTNPFPCPECKRDLEAPAYHCNNCKLELIFYLSVYESKNKDNPS